MAVILAANDCMNIAHAQGASYRYGVIPGNYVLLAKDPSLDFCTERLRLTGSGNVITRMEFNENATVCSFERLTLVPRRPRSAGRLENSANSTITVQEKRPDSNVRLRSMERFLCRDNNLFRLLFRRYQRGYGIQTTEKRVPQSASNTTTLYRKSITLRTGGRRGPKCIYARGKQVIPIRRPTPSPTPSRTPSPSPSPSADKNGNGKGDTAEPSAVPNNSQVKSNRSALGIGFSITAAILAAISLTITVGCCWASRQPIYMPLCGFTASANRIWIGIFITILCTVAAICTGVLT